MADVEIIFPDKVVGIKPFQLVNLAITVIGALVAGAMVMWKVCVCHCAWLLLLLLLRLAVLLFVLRVSRPAIVVPAA